MQCANDGVALVVLLELNSVVLRLVPWFLD
jgi:hypothetical protein